MRALAFFDTRFQTTPAMATLADTPWQRLAAARPTSRRYGMPNGPGRLGVYDLADPPQARAVLELAARTGLDGFVVDCHPTDAGYLTGAEVLAPWLPAGFGLAFQWPLARDRAWAAADGSQARLARLGALVASLSSGSPLLVAGRIVLIVDRPALLPDTAWTLKHLRQLAAEAGLPGLYLIAAQANTDDALTMGYDALLDPGPADWASCGPMSTAGSIEQIEIAAGLREASDGRDRAFHLVLFAITRMIRRGARGKVMPRVFPAYQNWSAYPESGATLLVEPGRSGVNRHLFGAFLENALLYVAGNFAEDEALCFIDSWNGWFDGSQIEPSLLDGDQVLDTARHALDRARFVARTRRGDGMVPAIEPALRDRVADLCRASAALISARLPA